MALKPLRLAISKDGRLAQETLVLLSSCGLSFDIYENSLLVPCRNFPLTLLSVSDEDIPGYVAGRTAELGIVGHNVLTEHLNILKLTELRMLGFGQCRLVVAVPADAPTQNLRDLAGQRIATSYPNTVSAFFSQMGVPAEILRITEAAEIMPELKVADAVADISVTGSSLLLHELRSIGTIAESEAVLIVSPTTLIDPGMTATIDRFLLRLDGVLAARQYKYIMMNAPRASLEDIRAIVPGLRELTVVPLTDPSWVAVHTVVEETLFWEKIEQLRAAGASEILVTPIEKLVY